MSADIFHYQGLSYWGPLGTARMEALYELLGLRAGHRVLDVGCGSGELLIRLAERCGVGGVGVDRSTAALNMARKAIERRAPATAIEFFEADANAYAPEAPFDAVAWLGGPVLGDDYPTTIARLAGWTKHQLLVGHGFWNKPPPKPYLQATGLNANEFTDSWGNIKAAQEHGLRLLYTSTSNRDEWDHFEGRILLNVERYAADHPDAPDPQGRLQQRREWNEAQIRWGRDCMGFGLYLFART